MLENSINFYTVKMQHYLHRYVPVFINIITFFFCRIAGLDYGDREIEYLIDGPRDEHRLPIQELLSRLVTDVGTGLTTPQVQANLQLYGPNAIADSLQVPEWVRFCKCMFGGSTLVLWGGMLLSFTYYSINAGLVSTISFENYQSTY